MDATLLFVGLGTALYAMFFLLLYLWREKGTIFSPVAMGWIGYIAFISGGMVLTAVFSPAALSASVREKALLFVCAGTVAYTVGLYLGRGDLIQRMIPRPRKRLGKGTLWGMLLLFLIIAPISWGMTLTGLVPGGAASVARAFNDASLSGVVLVSLMMLLTLRGSYGTKAVMIVLVIAGFLAVLMFYWSRRPLVALAMAALGLLYREKLMRKSLTVRATWIVLIASVGFVLLLYLTGSRGARFYQVTQISVFSMKNFLSLVGTFVVNYRVYEFAIERFSEVHDLLLGEGFVPYVLFFIPRSIWESKPDTAAWLITKMWFGTSDPPSNVGALIFGEMFMNFGFVFGAAAMALAGKFVRVLDRYLTVEFDNQVLWLAWLAVIPDFATAWRGIGVFVVQSFLRVSLFLIFAWLASRVLEAGGATVRPYAQQPTA
jgi:oligosaccharide repeat unit polymerase